MRPALAASIVAALALLPALSGCSALKEMFAPAPPVRITDLEEGDGAWNRESRFQVITPTDSGIAIRIVAENLADGTRKEASGHGNVTLRLPDGSWSITYHVDGKRRGVLEPVRIDTVAPRIIGLEETGDAPQRSYTLGASATVDDPAARVTVVDAGTGAVAGSGLPLRLTGLADGLRVFRVTATDPAGNEGSQSVHVRVGSATSLPVGQWTYGVVARYTNTLQVWDISDPSRYLARPLAAQAAGPGYLDAGFGVEPDDPTVAAVAESVVAPGMNTVEAAIALYRWMMDNLEYDENRLDDSTLLRPAQVIADGEDPDDHDADGDGLVRDGAGNGVRGGVCRDLAATYVSLLRAAGVPARLVSGYVGGEVDGFHAWAEFYGGPIPGQDPWVPVDVSGLDGPYEEGALLQAFGILPADFLPLRPLAPGEERAGWSTALAVRYQWPGSMPAPEVAFRKEVQPAFEDVGVLCFDPADRARLTARRPEDCAAAGMTRYYGDQVLSSERTIDYGIEVVRAPAGTHLTGEVAFPMRERFDAEVAYLLYPAQALREDAQDGKAHVEADL